MVGGGGEEAIGAELANLERRMRIRRQRTQIAGKPPSFGDVVDPFVVVYREGAGMDQARVRAPLRWRRRPLIAVTICVAMRQRY